MGRFIKLLGNRKYSIKKNKNGLEITWVQLKKPNNTSRFKSELFTNWSHLFANFE